MAQLNLRKPLENTTLTIEVKVTREFRVRLFVGMALIRLAVLTLGGKTELKTEST